MWIDTDTASDDVVALIVALKHPDIEVVGISVVAGNVPLDMAVQNALITLERCGSRVPVHAGAAAPLCRPLQSAQEVHGNDGMGDIGLDLHGRVPTSHDGIGAMLDAFRAAPGEIELVTLGPLTNVAVAVRSEPKFAKWAKRCVCMAGTGVLPGNVTPLSEFNVWADPEAAHVVFESGLLVEMVGWDVSWQDAAISDDLAADLRAISPLGEFASTSNAMCASSVARSPMSTVSISPIRSRCAWRLTMQSSPKKKRATSKSYWARVAPAARRWSIGWGSPKSPLTVAWCYAPIRRSFTRCCVPRCAARDVARLNRLRS